VAAGLYRTANYIGTIFSASLIGRAIIDGSDTRLKIECFCGCSQGRASRAASEMVPALDIGGLKQLWGGTGIARFYPQSARFHDLQI
jgi:hypothetical protein